MNMEFILNYKNKKYKLEWFEDIDFSKLKNVIQCYGFVFNKDKKVCVVDCFWKGRKKESNTGWTLPGGSVEPEDKTYEDTLRREVKEEADLDIKDIRPLGYFKVTPLYKNSSLGVHYLLRYFARVKKINPQTKDPAYGIIPKRKFINSSEFLEYCKWDEESTLPQINKALNFFKQD